MGHVVTCPLARACREGGPGRVVHVLQRIVGGERKRVLAAVGLSDSSGNRIIRFFLESFSFENQYRYEDFIRALRPFQKL